MIKNYQILKETLNIAIQNSNLDIGAVYFILKDTLSTIEKLYYSQINKECIEEQKTNSEDQIEKENNKEKQD